jgi:sec-independent protein translocase protein TatC
MSDEKKPETDDAEGVMTIWEHLEELRSRVIKMMGAFLIGAIVAWVYHENILRILAQPFVEAWNSNAELKGVAALYYPAPASAFIAYVRLSALTGIVAALPIILWQIWSFVAPGLYSREKRFAIPFVVTSCLLFAGGGYFGWKIAFPAAFQFLLGFGGDVGSSFKVVPTVMVPDYIEFVMHMLLAFGIAAELPVLVFFLSVAGVVTHRHLIKFARYFVVIAFVISAIITPPDPMSQLLLAIPLCLLYVVSIGVAWLFSRKRVAAEDAAAAADQSSRA